MHKGGSRLGAQIARKWSPLRRSAPSISDFVVAAAQEAAHRTIEEAHIIRLSIEDQQRFVDLLLNPRPLSPALRRARKAHTRLIRESR